MPGSPPRLGLTLRLTLVLLAVAGLGVGAIGLAVPRLAAPRGAMVAGAALAGAFVVVVALLVRRWVVQPVTAIRAVAHRMAEGQLDRLAPGSGRDEIAELAHALNRMSEALREKIESLEGERARVAAILDSMVEGVIAVDARGRVLLMNPGSRAIFSLGPEPPEGRPLLEVVRQKELLDLVATAQGEPAGGRVRRELDLGPPVSRTLDAQAVAVPFAPHGGGILLVLHDVTEVRRLERVKTEFVANVSHELRTPLTAIRGYLETLLGGALDEATHARRFLEIAHVHADRLGRLVDDLLQLSDIETGRIVLTPMELTLHDVAASVLAMFEREAGRRGVTLVNQVPPGLAVRADRDRLAQILVNLVDNAVKYTPAGGTVTLGAASTAAGPIEIRVADTGIGIPSTDLPRLTERFYRVDRARSRELGGTGLGLAIVKHLVQAHGGTLAIDSELGKGTTVRFALLINP
ncbi:MAG TPA: ATP-binding protein [Methylomirabilota bacterium]|nr:ATP-binding protein [Methylomirabilota bacterium]